jgi:hypothetical protein
MIASFILKPARRTPDIDPPPSDTYWVTSGVKTAAKKRREILEMFKWFVSQYKEKDRCCNVLYAERWGRDGVRGDIEIDEDEELPGRGGKKSWRRSDWSPSSKQRR